MNNWRQGEGYINFDSVKEMEESLQICCITLSLQTSHLKMSHALNPNLTFDIHGSCLDGDNLF